MDEKRLRKLARLDEAPSLNAITSDLGDLAALFRSGNSDRAIRMAALKVLGEMDTREKAAIAIFVANLADELDPDVP